MTAQSFIPGIGIQLLLHIKPIPAHMLFNHFHPFPACFSVKPTCVGITVSWTPALWGRGLRLDSTATRHTARGVPLWLHGPTYPGTSPLGVLTRRPCSSSLAAGAAFGARRFA